MTVSMPSLGVGLGLSVSIARLLLALIRHCAGSGYGHGRHRLLDVGACGGELCRLTPTGIRLVIA